MTVTLRPWALTDASRLAYLMDNPKIHANLRDGLPSPYTEDDAAAFIRTVQAAPEDSQYSSAILADGQLAGSIGIFRGENIHRRTAELGYFIGEDYWGAGVMTAAVRQACHAAFAATDLVRIYAEPFAGNRASCRVLEKAGFVHEGTLRKNAVKDGVVIDMELYALVRD